MTAINVNDLVRYNGQTWAVEAVREQFEGRALVANLRCQDSPTRHETSVCFWRAEGETRPLTWSPDGAIEPTGKRLVLLDGRLTIVEVPEPRAIGEVSTFEVLRVTATEAYDVDSEDPSSYTLHASISTFGGIVRRTTWSALLDLTHSMRPYTFDEWESIDQWADPQILARLGTAAAVEIGEAVIAWANAHGVTA